MRIVSLTCSNTEIVCALGCAEYLVGVDNHSDYPEDVVSVLPRVGPDLQIDIAKVQALKPDIVLASLTVPGHEKIIEGLEQAKLNYIAPEPISLEDIYADIMSIAVELNVIDRATKLIEVMRNEIVNSTNVKVFSPKILIQWWPKPVIAPAQQSWVNGLIEAAGGVNPLADRPVKSLPLKDEEVVDINPDAIVIAWCGVKPDKYRPEVVYRNKTFGSLDAIQNKRIYCISEAYLGRPSPRVVDGYRSLKKITSEITN
jgi:iron complex transport system substrate-binding protein